MKLEWWTWVAKAAGSAPLLGVLFWVGCSDGGGGSGGVGVRREVGSEANLGSLVVLLDRTAITVVDSVRLELVAECGAEVSVRFPRVGGNWGKWTVVGESQVERSVLSDGKVRSRRSYTLEPYLAGDYVVPEFGVFFEKVGGERDVAIVGAIPVVVGSVLEVKPEEAELVEAYGDVELEGAVVGVWWWWLAGGIGFGVLGGLVVWLCWKKKDGGEVAVVSDRERLTGELVGLLGEGRVDAARLCQLAGKVEGAPKDLAGRIEALAYSEGAVDGDEVRGAAEELREVLTKGVGR